MNNTTAIARAAEPAGLVHQEQNDHAVAVVPADMSVEVFEARIKREEQMRGMLADYVRRNMKDGYHFSTKLGTQDLAKPMLLQDGCRNICSLLKLQFGEPTITETPLDGDHYRVRVHIVLYNAEGRQVASGDAVCSTRETKYAYRKGERTCPTCHQPHIRKDNQKGGWYCWQKIGGCGQQFAKGSPEAKAIEEQKIERVDNPDKADIENTVLKMAVKRAKSAAVCDVPMVSEIFAPETDGAGTSDEGQGKKRSSSPQQPRSVRPERAAAGGDTPAAATSSDDADAVASILGEINDLMMAKFGDGETIDQDAADAFLNGRNLAVMPLAALVKLKGELAAL